MKALNVEEQSVQETEQEERVRPVQPRRKQRQLNQKVRYEQSVAEEAVVAPVVEETVAAEPIVQEAACLLYTSPPMTSNARVRRVKVSSPPGLVFPQLPGENPH